MAKDILETETLEKGIERILKSRRKDFASVRTERYPESIELLNLLGYDNEGNQYYMGFVDSRYKIK